MISHRENAISDINKIIKNKRKSVMIEKSIYNVIVYQSKIAGHEVDNWDDDSVFLGLYLFSIKEKLFEFNKFDSTIDTVKSMKKNKLEMYGSIPPHERVPERWEHNIEKLKQIAESRKEESNTDQFYCPMCKSNNCMMNEIQTRSADEPMTTFLKCLDCGTKWKK